MAPYVGKSGTLLNLKGAVASGLIASGIVVEVEEGLTAEQLAKIASEKFGGNDPVAEATPKASTTVEKPRGNASRDDWVAYALSQGKSEDDLAGLKQGEIRELLEPVTTENPETGSTESGDEGQGDGGNSDDAE